MPSLSQLFPSLSLRSDVPSRARAGTVALWIVQALAAAMFFYAGFLKLTGAPAMMDLFTAIGFGQWFRYLTGGLEILAAVLLVIPRTAVFGALLMVPTMIGALITHAVLGGSAVSAFMLLVATSAIVWYRRGELTRALSRLR